MQDRIIQEIEVIKELGDSIGYGHLMEIASALWRKSLEDKGCPKSGAFVPTVIDGITKDYQKAAKISYDTYDAILKEFYAAQNKNV